MWILESEPKRSGEVYILKHSPISPVLRIMVSYWRASVLQESHLGLQMHANYAQLLM